jgi:preprotein translocase subunit SecD
VPTQSNFIAKVAHAHDNELLLSCRIVRGGWMVVMMLITSEHDISSSFTHRRLAAGVSAELVVLQLLMLFTLVLLGELALLDTSFLQLQRLLYSKCMTE